MNVVARSLHLEPGDEILTTDQEYGDIELLIDYKTVPLADSGIYLRGCPQVQIWDYTDDRRFTINELYRQNAVCELKIYQVVSEMLRIGQIATVHPTPQPQPQAPPELAKAS